MKLPFDTAGRDSLRLWQRWLLAAVRNDSRSLFFPSAGPSASMPAQFLVALTYKCDSRCTHCAIWTEYRKRPELESTEMTLAEFERFLDANPQLLQVPTTGGELFNRSDIVEAWLALDRRGYRTNCATNALSDDIVDRETFLLARLSGRHLRHFGVSLDGVEPVHDRIRGMPGNFARAWRLFRWACEQEQRYPFYRTEISSTLTAANYREFPTLVDWLVREGVPPQKIGFLAALPSGHYYKNEKICQPVPANDELVSMLEELQAKHPGFGRGYFTESYLQWLRDASSKVVCRAGTVCGYIDPYWNVYPCVVRGDKLGNLRDFDFDVRRLWQSDAARQFRSTLAAQPCNGCFNECNRWNSVRATTAGLAGIAWRQARRILSKGQGQRRWRM